MTIDKTLPFTRLADGTILVRETDGRYSQVRSETDLDRLSALTDDEIELMSVSDPDHPALDDGFWADVDLRAAAKETISIKLDDDILSYFRDEGRGYQTRINAVLRHYVDTVRKTKVIASR